MKKNFTPRSERPASEAQLAKIIELEAEGSKPRKGRATARPLVASYELYEAVMELENVALLYTREAQKVKEAHFYLALEGLENLSMEEASSLIKALSYRGKREKALASPYEKHVKIMGVSRENTRRRNRV